MEKHDKRTRRKNNINMTLDEVLMLDIELPKRKNFNNLTNKTFNELSVIKYYGIKNKTSHWYCLCSCGQITIVSNNNLTSGHIISCGHISEERFGVTTHGKSWNLTYVSWVAMKDRCSKKSGKDYERYVLRGIKVCDRWLDSFENFLEDMGERPSKKYSLERINNNLGYFKENCRWATMIEQSNNRRTNCLLEYNGEIKTIKEWSIISKISYSTLKERINRGWSVERALIEPCHIKYRKKNNANSNTINT